MAPARGDPPGTPFSMASPRTSGGLADLDEMSRLRDDNVTVRRNQQTDDPPTPRILEMPAQLSEPQSTPFSPVDNDIQDQQQQQQTSDLASIRSVDPPASIIRSLPARPLPTNVNCTRSPKTVVSDPEGSIGIYFSTSSSNKSISPSF